METRANYVWVGTITLVLLALLAGVALWVAHLSRGERVAYDIFFPQSVDGLAKGSTVTYAGVPAGQITEIALWEKDPSYVRVRVALSPRARPSRRRVPTTAGRPAARRTSSCRR